MKTNTIQTLCLFLFLLIVTLPLSASSPYGSMPLSETVNAYSDHEESHLVLIQFTGTRTYSAQVPFQPTLRILFTHKKEMITPAAKATQIHHAYPNRQRFFCVYRE